MKKFVRLSDGAVVTEADIDQQMTVPNDNFRPDEELYAPILEADKPTPASHLEKVEEAEPVKKDGKWVKEFRKRPATQEEIDAATKAKAVEVLSVRDKRLRDSDWTQLADADKKVQGDYVPYRAALRDISTQPGFPFSVDWPVKP